MAQAAYASRIPEEFPEVSLYSDALILLVWGACRNLVLRALAKMAKPSITEHRVKINTVN
jgi:hypothetical protein